MHNPVRTTSLLLLSFITHFALQAQPAPRPTPADTVQAGPYDMGKMWTFDNPPTDYFKKTYGFAPDAHWFDEARLASLRFADYCSASFVSANGLVMTNHHCARESGTGVARKGENLNATGFFAKTSAEERPVDGLFVDQLVKLEDITKQVQEAVTAAGADEAAQVAAREKIFGAIKIDYTNKPGWQGLELQTITFYNGGKYALYGFKRYTDVRLVFMPELQLGFFGGDPDNFTYPRYALDCSFFRVYDKGKPLKTTHFFKFNPNGIREGEPTFVTGNPGSTERLKTVAELEFDRDLKLPQLLTLLRSRSSALQTYNVKAKNDSVLNEIFGLENSIKAYKGQLDGLRDPYLLARKAAFEKQFKADAQKKGGSVSLWTDIAATVSQQQTTFNDYTYFAPNPLSTGETLTAALTLGLLTEAAAQNPRVMQQASAMLDEVPKPKSRALEEAYLTAHLTEVQSALGNDDPYVKAALTGPNGLRTPREAAAYLLANSKIGSRLVQEGLIAKGVEALTSSTDPLLVLGRIGGKRFLVANEQVRQSTARQEVLRSQLGRLLFATYGTTIPPDATFSLRINDGVVKGYPYNGTVAPVFTTFAGLYDRSYSFSGKAPWNLPARWANPPAELLKQPMCFISTNDIIGGNSGSPMINKNREAVGLVFDGNMESLPGAFIFVPDANRAISVHAGGIAAALRYIYKADRLLTELLSK
ncbi:S46 family peptidase [Fibrella sp. HMF5335]|uniref:Dipeptidyl-peptidase n=1 Tax=Fibrella rubiginis TaxID=2817060 RepID=A0A939GIT7_9BACT|nr:S46 family peptidase [Fibrella rubiginis]MBO0939987.1 S46 family peptidase [Fibrella rubiginis]